MVERGQCSGGGSELGARVGRGSSAVIAIPVNIPARLPVYGDRRSSPPERGLDLQLSLEQRERRRLLASCPEPAFDALRPFVPVRSSPNPLPRPDRPDHRSPLG